MILEIVCPLPIEKSFDYKLPKTWGEKDPSDLIGRRVLISFGPRQVVGMIYKLKETSDAPLDKLKPATKLLDSDPLLSSEQIKLGEWLAARYASSLGEALFSLMPPGRGNPTSFKDPEAHSRYDQGHAYERTDSSHLTEEQTKAAEQLHNAIYHHEFQAFLLFGVAAAGKTEVYMAAIKDALAQGKSALILTPEIGLAVQTHEVLKNRFGAENVLLWHSDVTPKTRVQNWWRIKRNEFPIVIGPRSAVLAPLPNLGVVVVDEEHESSYKEDRKPRFHARDVAIERARQSNAVALLGSATPSLEMMHAGFSGEVKLIELKERAVRSSAPHVKLVDLNQERFKGAISLQLQKAIDQRKKESQQSILFLNKRGFHRYLKCANCEWVARCLKCNISLVEHKAKGLGHYMCHYCQDITQAPERCPDCKKGKFYSGGFGTQRLTEEIGERFPWARVLRWDRDSVSKRGEQQKVYENFTTGNYDILVGTQMVAHGFNFPKVTLVGVVEADGPLHLPDFRSAEKTFQLVTQVAGRAGRAMVTGDVLIQTKHPEHYALQHAINLDYEAFAKAELEFRQEFNYPPFSHLVQVITTSKKEAQAEKDIEDLSDWSLDNATIGVLGPTPAKRKKKGSKQFQILFKVPKNQLLSFLKALKQFSNQKRNRFSLDVDPESVA